MLQVRLPPPLATLELWDLIHGRSGAAGRPLGSLPWRQDCLRRGLAPHAISRKQRGSVRVSTTIAPNQVLMQPCPATNHVMKTVRGFLFSLVVPLTFLVLLVYGGKQGFWGAPEAFAEWFTGVVAPEATPTPATATEVAG